MKDVPTRLMVLIIVFFVGAVATILTLTWQGYEFDAILRSFLNYGVPSLIGLVTLFRVEKTKSETRDKLRTIEANTNGNLSKLIEKVGPVNDEKVEDEGR